jgi:hypothetical protein
MRFFVMVVVAAGVVMGILKYREKLEQLYGRYLNREQKMAVVGLESPGVLAGTAQNAQQISGTGQFLKAPRPELQNIVNASISIPEACKRFVAEVQNLDLLQLDKDQYRLSYQQLPLISESCRFTDPKITAVLQALEQACRAEGSLSAPVRESCASQLFMLRAVLTRLMMSARPLSSITDMRVLTDMMFAEFAQINGQTAPDLRTAQLVAERMLELDPKLYVAAKVAAYADVIQTLNRQQANGLLPDSEWNRSMEALQRTRQLNPEDPGLEGAEALVQTKGFRPLLCVEHAQSLLRMNDRNPTAWYLKSYGEWKLNQKSESRASLRRAVELAPGQRDYAQTLVAISQPSAGPHAFQGSLTFGVSSEDFQR